MAARAALGIGLGLTIGLLCGRHALGADNPTGGAIPDTKLARTCLHASGFTQNPRSFAVSLLDGATRYGVCIANDTYTGSQTWWKRDRNASWKSLGGSGGYLGADAATFVHTKYGIPEQDVAPLINALLNQTKNQKHGSQ